MKRRLRLMVNHRSFPPSQAHPKPGPFPPPALPGLLGLMALSDAQSGRHPCGDVRRRDPRQSRASPNDPDHLPYMPRSLPRCTGTGACWFLPCPRGLPRFGGGSASTSLLSRPAQASLTLRPARLLTHLTVGFIARLHPDQLPDSGARKLPNPTNNYSDGAFPHKR